MFHVAGHRLSGDSRPKKSLKREQGSVVITGSADARPCEGSGQGNYEWKNETIL